jgi:hypothetical protein
MLTMIMLTIMTMTSRRLHIEEFFSTPMAGYVPEVHEAGLGEYREVIIPSRFQLRLRAAASGVGKLLQRQPRS